MVIVVEDDRVDVIGWRGPLPRTSIALKPEAAAPGPGRV